MAIGAMNSIATDGRGIVGWKPTAWQAGNLLRRLRGEKSYETARRLSSTRVSFQLGDEKSRSNAHTHCRNTPDSLSLATKCKEWKYELHAANGAENHFHILVSLTPSMLTSDVAKNLKGATSHYINKESGLKETLYWQDGYGVVTVRKHEIPSICDYIAKQKEHHKVETLIPELEICYMEE